MHEIQFSSICANKGGHREIKFAGSDAPAAEESRRSLFLAARTPPLAGSSDERRAAMVFPIDGHQSCTVSGDAPGIPA